MKVDADDLDDLLRILRANEAWFDASHAWLASESCPDPRPLSLASLDALRLMNIEFAACAFDTREIALYRWLHIAPLHEVRSALWSGTWRLLFLNPEPLAEDIVAAFLDERDRVAAMIAAVTISVRPKPKSKTDNTPADVVAPTLVTFRVCTIAAHIRADLEQVRWHLPIVQALQVYHDALWESGRWTVRPGREVKPEDLADLTPDSLKEPGTGNQEP